VFLQPPAISHQPDPDPQVQNAKRDVDFNQCLFDNLDAAKRFISSQLNNGVS